MMSNKSSYRDTYGTGQEVLAAAPTVTVLIERGPRAWIKRHILRRSTLWREDGSVVKKGEYVSS